MPRVVAGFYAHAMELIFLRHGEPAWAVDGIGRSDPHLTERGHRQAVLAAERLAGEEDAIAEILVSPAVRAQQTADPLVELAGIQPTTIDDIIEIQNPSWEGTPEENIQQIFREARGRPPQEWWDGLPGGESFRDFHARITKAFDQLLAARSVVPDPSGRPHLWHVDTDPQRIVIVAHGGTNSVALTHLLSVEPTPWEWERFVLGHASLATVKAIPLAGEHVFTLRTFNDREHLPRELRTR
jgi:probable phosphoglycerate mutase